MQRFSDALAPWCVSACYRAQGALCCFRGTANGAKAIRGE